MFALAGARVLDADAWTDGAGRPVWREQPVYLLPVPHRMTACPPRA
jgi:hypothetical protein